MYSRFLTGGLRLQPHVNGHKPIQGGNGKGEELRNLKKKTLVPDEAEWLAAEPVFKMIPLFVFVLKISTSTNFNCFEQTHQSGSNVFQKVTQGSGVYESEKPSCSGTM